MMVNHDDNDFLLMVLMMVKDVWVVIYNMVKVNVVVNDGFLRNDRDNTKINQESEELWRFNDGC